MLQALITSTLLHDLSYKMTSEQTIDIYWPSSKLASLLDEGLVCRDGAGVLEGVIGSQD